MLRVTQGGSAPSSGVILEAYDLSAPGAANGLTVVRGGSTHLSSAGFWDGILGTGHPFGTIAGKKWRASSTVGAGASCGQPEWPIGQNLTTGGLTDAMLVRRLRYTFECLVVTVAASNNEIGVRNSANTLATGTTVLGYSLRANGANWTPVRRLVSGAGETILTPLVLKSVIVPRRLKMIYTEGLVPSLELQLDGDPVFTALGQAEMPNPLVGVAGYGPAVAAGSANAMQTAEAKLLVELL